jgi:protein gp37
MGENSRIEWCDHTLNFWVGCQKVSAACDFCYAESWAKRSGHSELWAGERRRASICTVDGYLICTLRLAHSTPPAPQQKERRSETTI